MKKVLTSISDEQIIGAIQSNDVEIVFYDSNFINHEEENYIFNLLIITSDEINNQFLSTLKVHDIYILGNSNDNKANGRNMYFFENEDSLRKALFIWPKKVKNSQDKDISTSENTLNMEVQVDQGSLHTSITGEAKENKIIESIETVDCNNAPPVSIKDDFPSTEYPINISHFSTNKIEAMRKQYVYKGKQYPQNKTIAVWSPLHRIGVSSFILNFAIYLQEQKIQTAVIEAMQPPKLSSVLSRYEPMPVNFRSFIEVFHLEEYELMELDYHKTNWQYMGVLWLPIGEKDYVYNWTEDFLEVYFQFFRYHDVILTDLPSGKMTEETEKVLQNIDELWVMVDNSIVDILMWKNYIHQLREKHGISMKLIYNRSFPFSKINSLVNGLELPLIGTIPDLTEEYIRLQYKKKPLISFDEVREKVKENYENLIKAGFQLDSISNSKKIPLKTLIKKLFQSRG